MWRNDTKHTIKVRGPDNKEKVYPPGAEIPELDHPRLKAAADNGELKDLTPPPPPAPLKPKSGPKVEESKPEPSTITEAVESVVKDDDNKEDESKKRKRKF